MSRSAWRWIVLTIAFWVLGPAAGWMMSRLRAPDGGPDVSILLAENPALSITAGAGAIGLAVAAGFAASRLFGARTGFFTAGLVLIWPAWASGSVGGILRRTQTGATLWTLAIEGVLVSAALMAGAWIIERVERKRDAGNAGVPRKGLGLPVSYAMAVAAAALAAWAVARTELPGQTIAAAFFAGLLGAMAAILADPRARMSHILAVAAVLLFLGPASAAAVQGDAVIQRLYDGSLIPLARPAPLQWAAGLLLGVPVGSSWAGSLVKSG